MVRYTLIKAIPLRNKKFVLLDLSVIQIVVWELPKPTRERPHGYKYRLNYSLSDGTTIVRYDNEIGKGDHKHIRDIEYPYTFETLDKLLADFTADVIQEGAKL